MSSRGMQAVVPGPCAQIRSQHDMSAMRHVRMTARPPEIDDRVETAGIEFVKGGSRGGRPASRADSISWYFSTTFVVPGMWVRFFELPMVAGCVKLYLCGITATPPRADIAKTALGADQAIAWQYHAYPQQAIEQVIADGYTPVVLENGESQSLGTAFEWPQSNLPGYRERGRRCLD